MLELDILRLDPERQVRASGSTAPGLSTLPFDNVTIGWNGGLPPSSVESFSRTRLWKTPALARRIVSWFSEYDIPRRGSKTL